MKPSLNGFYKPYNIRIKDDGSIVTDVDILVEKNIREIIKQLFSRGLNIW